MQAPWGSAIKFNIARRPWGGTHTQTPLKVSRDGASVGVDARVTKLSCIASVLCVCGVNKV